MKKGKTNLSPSEKQQSKSKISSQKTLKSILFNLTNLTNSQKNIKNHLKDW